MRDGVKFLALIARDLWDSFYGFFWTALFGRIVGCGAPDCLVCAWWHRKITVYDHRDVAFRQARADQYDRFEGKSRIYVRYVVPDDVMVKNYVATRECDITWCYGWDGANVDALKATVTMEA